MIMSLTTISHPVVTAAVRRLFYIAPDNPTLPWWGHFLATWGLLIIIALLLIPVVIVASTRQGRRMVSNYFTRMRSRGAGPIDIAEDLVAHASTNPGAAALLSFQAEGGGAAVGAESMAAVARQKGKKPTVTCPKCAAIVAEGIPNCPACGTALAPQSQSQQLMQEAAAKLCPACGAAVIAGAAACGACGAQAQPPRPSEQQLGRRRLGVLVRDVMVNGVVAFRKDEVVTIEKESPDPARPAYKYVVLSDLLSQRFRLSDDELQV